jgi:hypothetical protein
MRNAAGPDFDRELQQRVFGTDHAASVPPFSTRDWTALALAELVAERTSWRYQLIESAGTWTAIWFESARSRPVAAMVTARASTRALALCAALLKATRSPRWTTASGGDVPRPSRRLLSAVS